MSTTTVTTKVKCPKVNIRSRTTLPVYTDEEKTLLAEKIGMTLDQLKRYGNSAYRTYNALGPDLAICNDQVRRAIKREYLVEIVLDADRIDTYGGLEPDLKLWRDRRRFSLGNCTLEDYYAAVAAVAFPFALYE
jgi:hypothetical protein